MPPKRPAGLGASNKAKKNKQIESNDNNLNRDSNENPVEVEEGNNEGGDDWQDLLELWERCQNSLRSSEPASSAPLLRGILHETQRLINAFGKDLNNFNSIDDDGKEFKVNVNEFNTILSSSILELGVLISASSKFNDNSSLAVQGEPTKGRPFFFRAYSLAKSLNDDQNKYFIIARCSSQYLQERLESTNEDEEKDEDDEDDELKDLPDDGLFKLSRDYIHKLNLDHYSFDQLLNLASVTSTIEEILINIKGSSISVKLYDEALQKSVKVEQRFECLINKSRIKISRGSYLMDLIFDEDDNENDDDNKVKYKDEVEDICNELRGSITDLESAQNMTDDIEVNEDEGSELDSLIKEATITLANLLPEGKEQEDLFNKAGV